MLFTGEYEYTIDAKQRLAIPAEIRSHLHPERDGLAFYVTAGSNDALWLWPERTFERIAGAIEVSLLPAEEMMAFDEITFPIARRLEMDKTGRVRLPQAMLPVYSGPRPPPGPCPTGVSAIFPYNKES